AEASKPAPAPAVTPRPGMPASLRWAIAAAAVAAIAYFVLRPAVAPPEGHAGVEGTTLKLDYRLHLQPRLE
ncbi:MAG TPA: hypothetical protein VMG61_02425, partial [Usitatibacter sp.]|nr:hypothetical protein [Usitatibacter sp.]